MPKRKKHEARATITDVIQGCPVLVTPAGRVWIEFPGGRVLELDTMEAFVTLVVLEKYQDEIGAAAIERMEENIRNGTEDRHGAEDSHCGAAADRVE